MPTTISGNIKNLATGSVGSSQNAILRFILRGTGEAQPVITGTGAIAPTSANGIWYTDLAADANGAVSGTIYSTRDATGLLAGDITVSDSGTAVYYDMQVIANGMSGPSVSVHAKNGATLDPSSVTPITTPPVVSAPTGDTTYLQLTAGNGPLTGPLSSTSSINAKRIEGHKYADAYATGSGSSDDTTGIQTALNDAAGSTLHFPSGFTFRNSGTTWTVPANTTVVFDDATAKAVLFGGTGSASALFTCGGNNVRFANPQISDSRSFVLANASYGIFASGRTNVEIVGGYATGFSFTAIGIQDCSTVRIIGFRADANGSKNDGLGNFEGRGIDIETTGTTGSTDVVIANCVITNVGKHGINSTSAFSNYALDGCSITGCTIEDNGDTGINLLEAKNFTVSGNTLSKNGTNTVNNLGQGIDVSGTSSLPAINFSITGNTCNSNTENGIEAGFQAKAFSIVGNTCAGNGSQGIKLADVCSDYNVSANHCAGNDNGIFVDPSISSKSDGVTNGTTTFTSATANFTSSDVGKNIVIQNGNTGSAVYIGKISSRTNSTTVVLSAAPTSSSSGLTFWYGFFQNRISITGNQCHDNDESGINGQGAIDVLVTGNICYRNGLTVVSRAGIQFAQSQRVYVRASHLFDDQAVPTQAYAFRAFACDSVLYQQGTAYGNTTSNSPVFDGSTTNTGSETGLGNLVYATSPALTTPTIGGGSTLTRYARYTPTLSPASVAANTTAEQTFTSVLTSGDVVVGVSKPTAQAGLGIVGWRASGTSLCITFSNNTAGSITPTASETYQVVAVQ